MSFASYPFILLFLPASVLGCLVLGRLGTRAAMAALVVGSLVFYGWSDPRLVMLLVGSALLNHLIGGWLWRLVDESRGARRAFMVLAAGGVADLMFDTAREQNFLRLECAQS